MPSLLEVQREIHRALCGEGAAPHCIRGHDAAARLAIHRGTIRGALVKALRLSFPTVERLVGAEFFEQAAGQFVHAHEADEADLNAYGAGFPAFLERLAQCAHLAYLPDVARLDWAVARALHAPDAPSLAPDVLTQFLGHAEELVFVAHPAVSLLRSAFPVHEIWHAVLARDDTRLADLDVDSGPVHLVVQRIDDEVDVVSMPQQEWRFAEAIMRGMPLGRAIEIADIDAPASIARHLAAGHLVAAMLAQEQETP